MDWAEFGHRWIRVAELTTSRYFIIAGGSFLIFYFLLKNTLFSRRMQSKFPQRKDYLRDISFSLVTILIFATMAALTSEAVRCEILN